MRDFDAERQGRGDRDLEFRIGGETFRMLPAVRPEVIAGFDAIKPRVTLPDGTVAEEGTPPREVLSIVDQMVLDMTEPGGHERWKQLRARVDDPVTFDDLHELAAWLISEQVGRPTTPPGASTNGRASGDTTLTGGFSSPASLPGRTA